MIVKNARTKCIKVLDQMHIENNEFKKFIIESVVYVNKRYNSELDISLTVMYQNSKLDKPSECSIKAFAINYLRDEYSKNRTTINEVLGYNGDKLTVRKFIILLMYKLKQM
ncbi:MAG: hypothetical protein ACRCXT_13290 [Paraclostridium sp.]